MLFATLKPEPQQTHMMGLLRADFNASQPLDIPPSNFILYKPVHTYVPHQMGVYHHSTRSGFGAFFVPHLPLARGGDDERVNPGMFGIAL